MCPRLSQQSDNACACRHMCGDLYVRWKGSLSLYSYTQYTYASKASSMNILMVYNRWCQVALK